MHENQNEVILIIIISTALILLLGSIVVAGLLIQQKRKHRHQQQLLEINNRYEKSLLESQLKIQEEIFQAISQNLHDNIGSNISTIMLLLYKDEQMKPEELESNRKEALAMLRAAMTVPSSRTRRSGNVTMGGTGASRPVAFTSARFMESRQRPGSSRDISRSTPSCAMGIAPFRTHTGFP